MEIIGYSERGIINSLFYEIKYSNNDLKLLDEFLSLISFPYRPGDEHFQISDAKILIEQSFSNFGDADAVLLVNNQGKKQVIFVEAKVKTYKVKKWEISKEFDEITHAFLDPNQPKVSSSNLFIQLYHKVLLIDALRMHLSQRDGQYDRKQFSDDNTKIGSHKIVLDAVELLVPYRGEAFFIALSPDNDSNLNTFYQSTLKEDSHNRSVKWKVGNWGYLFWAKVEDFCKKNILTETQNVFKHNEGQIY